MSKFKCTKCDKSFNTKRALGSHQVAHKSGPRYTVSRKTIGNKIHICQFCSNGFPHSSSSYNKFCSIRCYYDWKWENDTKLKVIEGISVNVPAIKRYLSETFGNQCSECNLGPKYNGKPLVLQLDHIDGNSDNNVLQNLRLLCPNCHSQTPTFGNAGNGNRYKKNTRRNKYLQEYKRG